jgi:hypothetical protein
MKKINKKIKIDQKIKLVFSSFDSTQKINLEQN